MVKYHQRDLMYITAKGLITYHAKGTPSISHQRDFMHIMPKGPPAYHPPVEEGICIKCDLNRVEDEYHFIRIYELYERIRTDLCINISEIEEACVQHE